MIYDASKDMYYDRSLHDTNLSDLISDSVMPSSEYNYSLPNGFQFKETYNYIDDALPVKGESTYHKNPYTRQTYEVGNNDFTLKKVVDNDTSPLYMQGRLPIKGTDLRVGLTNTSGNWGPSYDLKGNAGKYSYYVNGGQDQNGWTHKVGLGTDLLGGKLMASAVMAPHSEKTYSLGYKNGNFTANASVGPNKSRSVSLEYKTHW